MASSVSSLPTIYPLDNNGELIRLLSELTDESREVVIQRLIDEEEVLGTNVRRDQKRRVSRLTSGPKLSPIVAGGMICSSDSRR
jgi:hypothetical protein